MKTSCGTWLALGLLPFLAAPTPTVLLDDFSVDQANYITIFDARIPLGAARNIRSAPWGEGSVHDGK